MASDSPSYSLDSHEMRCLSMMKPMAFLMAVEYDLFLAATKADDEPLEVQFPAMAPELKKGLHLCAHRFGLAVIDTATKIAAHGRAQLPLLRYVDFLPGQLHVDEALSAAGVKFSGTQPTLSTAPALSPTAKHVFAAAAIDYATYGAEDPKFEAIGFYYTIDAGLPLATMGHLLRFEAAGAASAADAVKSFQRFSHWQKFDLRWDDETTKRTGIIVLPSTTDVHELFERYEDEDTGDDATLLFRLRPVGACAHVPYLEDALLRRIRDQAWSEVQQMWKASPHSLYGLPTITVSGFTSNSVDELLGLVDKVNVVDASLVVEDGPSKRRRLYVNLNSAEAVRQLLAQDGSRSALPGKPTLRIQVAPPYLSASRRGTIIMTAGARGARSPSPQAEHVDPVALVAPQSTEKKQGKPQPQQTPSQGRDSKSRSPQAQPAAAPAAASPAKAVTAAGGSPATKHVEKKPEPSTAQQHAAGKGRSPQAAPAAPVAPASKSPQAQPTPQQAAKGRSPQAQPKDGPSKVPAKSPAGPGPISSKAEPVAVAAAPAAAAAGPGGMRRTGTDESDAPPMERQSTAEPNGDVVPVSKSKLNKSAAPFVPSGSPQSTFTAPPPPPAMPPPYAVAAPAQAGLPPPPYLPPPPTYLQTTSPINHMVPHAAPAMPPPYSLSGAVYSPPPPPPYSKTPVSSGRPAPPPYPASGMGTPMTSESTLPPAPSQA